MDIRAKLNENPKLTTAVTLILVILVVGGVAWNSFRDGGSNSGGTKEYFTTADTLTGEAAVETLFAADSSKVPPFDHGGKPAYRARVYTCDGGKTKFIAYLERFTPKAKEAIEKAQAKLKPDDPSAAGILSMHQNSMEVKKPGPGPWVKASDLAQSDSVIAIVCPPGQDNKNLEPVLP